MNPDAPGHPRDAADDNIVRAMARTSHAMRRYLEHSAVEVPGGMSSWHVLRALHHCGPATQADVARWLGIAGSTLTRRLEQMEDDGLIERADDPDDARRVIVRMTARAEDEVAAQHARMSAEIDKLTDGIAPADLEAVTRVIAGIHENLDALGVDVGHGRGGHGPGGRRGPGGGRGRRGRGEGRGPDGGGRRGGGPGGGHGRGGRGRARREDA